jgi:predicted DCC family thiol-disulfide oxidoreductase YuxK
MENSVILFDGVCNLCNGFVGFIIERDHQKVFRFSSLQSEFGQVTLKAHHLPADEFYSVILLQNGQVFQKSDAVLRIARQLPGYKWLTVFKILPRFFRDFIYELVARNRYRLFGRQDSCMLPSKELLGRFL